MEEWKDIPGYEGHYKVSSLGQIKSLKLNRERILLPNISGKGYYYISLCKDGKVKVLTIHSLVAIAFMGHTPDGTNKITIDHIDNNKLNNSLSNLKLISNRENSCKDKPGMTGAHRNISSSRKFKSSIQIDGVKLHLGYFDTEEEASAAYHKALNASNQQSS